MLGEIVFVKLVRVVRSYIGFYYWFRERCEATSRTSGIAIVELQVDCKTASRFVAGWRKS